MYPAWRSIMNAASSDQGAVRDMAVALPDAEEFLDSLAVQVAGVHTAEHVEKFWKSLKPSKLCRHRESFPLRHVRERSGII